MAGPVAPPQSQIYCPPGRSVRDSGPVVERYTGKTKEREAMGRARTGIELGERKERWREGWVV
jgi:hypothetical protein